MESTKETVETYTEPDGTKVVKRTIITRTSPSGQKSSSNLISDGRLAPSSSPSFTLNYADPKTLNEFEKACLNKHNEYRKLHGVPPLQMSKEVHIFINQFQFNLYFFKIALCLRSRMGRQHCQQRSVVASSQQQVR